MTTATALPTRMTRWADGTVHYAISDGSYIAVEASATGLPETAEPNIEAVLTVLGSDLMSTKQVPRPTHIIACNEEGIALSMTPLHTFPPGTTHQEALAQAGYETEGLS